MKLRDGLYRTPSRQIHSVPVPTTAIVKRHKPGEVVDSAMMAQDI
jgi:hypothetical protein